MTLYCPVCDKPELNTKNNTLNIRGYKISDRHGYWSQCLGNHKVNLDGKDIDTGSIWFAESEMRKKTLIEVNGKLYEFKPA
jgi:CRISPR/Cas system CSM-associated protein Csm4 (group 5 of RAMP superfamily)